MTEFWWFSLGFASDCNPVPCWPPIPIVFKNPAKIQQLVKTWQNTSAKSVWTKLNQSIDNLLVESISNYGHVPDLPRHHGGPRCHCGGPGGNHDGGSAHPPARYILPRKTNKQTKNQPQHGAGAQTKQKPTPATECIDGGFNPPMRTTKICITKWIKTQSKRIQREGDPRCLTQSGKVEEARSYARSHARPQPWQPYKTLKITLSVQAQRQAHLQECAWCSGLCVSGVGFGPTHTVLAGDLD